MLKGPQGVNLGRNVVGGAVTIVTQDPLPYREATASLLLGNYDHRQLQFTLNEPIQNGDAAVRLSGLFNDRDGLSENTFVGADQDDEGLRSWRLQYQYNPRSDLLLNVAYHDSREQSSRYISWAPDPNVPGSGALAFGGTVADDPRELRHNFVPDQTVRKQLLGVRFEQTFDDLVLSSATSFQRNALKLRADIDGTDLNFSVNAPEESSRVFTQELRLRPAHNVGGFDWLAGVYLLHEEAEQVIDVTLPLVSARNRVDGAVDTDSWAVFGEASYAFAERWEITAGLRYSVDRRRLDLVERIEDPLGALGPPGTTVNTQQDSDRWESLMPEVSLVYSADAHTLFWAKVSEGQKAGGFNTSAVQPGFDPETLLATEVGLKKSFPSLSLYTEVALFHYDYRDMQLLTPPAGAPLGTFPQVINAAKSTIQGLDLVARYRPVPPVGLNFGMTWLDARFDEFVSQDPNRPGSDPNHAGGRLPNAPKVSLNLGADYTLPTEGGGQWTAGVDYRYQSEVYYNIYQDPATRQGDYGLVNASLVYRDPKRQWSLQFYGNNLTDEAFWQGIIRQDPLIGTLRNPGAPRTFGMRASVRF